MDIINKTYEIKAPLSKVWEALTNSSEIEKWGAGPNVVMEAKEGQEFSLWGGDIYGKNIEVIKEKLLKQEWYGGDWENPSIVTFSLESEGEMTNLHLEHIDFPPKVTQEEFDGFATGWDDFYVGPLKKLVEEE